MVKRPEFMASKSIQRYPYPLSTLLTLPHYSTELLMAVNWPIFYHSNLSLMINPLTIIAEKRHKLTSDRISNISRVKHTGSPILISRSTRMF